MDVYNGDYIDTEGRRLNWPEEFLRKNTETTEIQRQAFTKAVQGRRAHRVRHRLRRVSARTQCAPVSDHGGARHDAHAGDSVRHDRGRAVHGPGVRDVGTIEPDKFGDIIAVKGDPLQDISVLQNVAVVVKGGMLFKNDVSVPEILFVFLRHLRNRANLDVPIEHLRRLALDLELSAEHRQRVRPLSW